MGLAPKTRIVVEIAELGPDGRRDMLRLLTAATAEDQVHWTVEEVRGEPHQGVAEIIFVAVTTKVAEQLVVKAEAVVGPWCRRGLDEVWHRIRSEPVDTDTDTDAGADTGTDADADSQIGAAQPVAHIEGNEG
jgi:hypothetical protein